MQEPSLGLGDGFRSAERGEEHLGMMVVAADLNTGEGDHADPRILDLGANQFGEILLNLVAYAAEPGRIFRHLWIDMKGVRSGPAIRLPASCLMGMVLQTARDFHDFVDFELIADFEIVKVLHGQAALEAAFDFADIVLEALQRIEFTRMNHDVVPKHAD